MNVAMGTGIRLMLLACALTALAGRLHAAEPAAGDELVSRSAGRFASERQRDATRAPSELEEQRLATSAAQRSADTPDKQRAMTAGCCPFRIFDAGVELFYDLDDDGYFHYLRVSFDADTDYHSAHVYAQLYLSRDGGPWQLYYVTDVFLIEGSSAFDDYEVETELVSGYRPGLYDVLIELYDADYDEFVAEFGPADTSALALLPLEDVGHDTPPRPRDYDRHGGGSLDWSWLAFGLVALARRRRQAD